MKRRNFIGGLISSIALIGTTTKAKSEEVKIIRTEDDNFYNFFYRFNGFPINEMQKRAFQARYSQYNMGTRIRRSGASVFLMTLAAWEANRGKQVMLAHTNNDLGRIVKIDYFNKCQKMGIIPTPVDSLVAHDSSDYNLCGRSWDIVLHDCSGESWNMYWWDQTDHRYNDYRLALRTAEL